MGFTLPTDEMKMISVHMEIEIIANSRGTTRNLPNLITFKAMFAKKIQNLQISIAKSIGINNKKKATSPGPASAIPLSFWTRVW